MSEEDKRFVDSHTLEFCLPRKHALCPYCQSDLIYVDGYRAQKLKGIVDTDLTYVYRKRRYRCRACKKTFAEENSFLEKYQRMPTSVIKTIAAEHSELITATLIAKRHHVSPPTVIH